MIITRSFIKRDAVKVNTLRNLEVLQEGGSRQGDVQFCIFQLRKENTEIIL